MRTPCQSEPEMWVSDDPNARAEAMRLCAECPADAFAACAALAVDTCPDLGVYAGKDWSRSNRVMESRNCQQCNRPFQRSRSESAATWARRTYCSRKCAGVARSVASDRWTATKACVLCGTEVTRSYESHAQWESRRFCSPKCARVGRYAA